MRESINERRSRERKETPDQHELPCDEKTYWESFFRSNLREEEIRDRVTLGAVTEPEARFHYNSVENAIIRAWARLHPPPPGVMAGAWHGLQRRAGLRLLDIGSGTGHWIDFFRETFLVSEAVGIEITETMAGFLRKKYAGEKQVRILELDVAGETFETEALGGAFDYVTAIGVMFHIVEDERWERAVAHLASILKPEGLLFVGDEFGEETRAVQFHRNDRFESWREAETVEGVPGEVRVNKRVRSLEDWKAVVARSGLTVVDLLRTESEPTLTTPENDILVLRPDAP